VSKYESAINGNPSCKLAESLEKEAQEIQKITDVLNVPWKYEHLKYENILYDYLTEFSDLKNHLKEELRVPTGIMIDLYDGLLKL
jgi:hypothetical protein